MSYFLQGFGVFLGVLAGTAVTVLTGLYLQRRGETQQTRNLRFELELNIRKLQTWREELDRWRNAVNGDSLSNYFGYFDLGRTVSVTANAMFLSGLLYKKLSHEQIGELQEIFSELSPHGEQYINNQVSQGKQAFEQCRSSNTMDLWSSQLKSGVVGYIDFWERKFNEHQTTLRAIVASLS